MHVGVDVGGTNTDAVLVDGGRIIASHKTPTSTDIGSGIGRAIRRVLDSAACRPAALSSIMLGTTQFTNAFVERRRLTPVGVIRLALPSTTAIRPMVDWPPDLKAAIGDHVALLPGGYEIDGREIAALDEDGVRRAARGFAKAAIQSIVLSTVNAPIRRQMEDRAASIVAEELPGAAVTQSAEIGRIGMVERENAAIMNASLAGLAQNVVSSMRKSLQALGIEAPFFLSQNDGTLMTVDRVARFPVLTFASGPTNSMRGAAMLSGLKDAIVVDIGGTTTDIGCLDAGFPRESSVAVDIGGVRTNFRMPDIISIGIGGGSIVRSANGAVTVGPDSVGHQLTQRALVFGGNVLTATDIIVAAGKADIGDRARVKDVPPAVVEAAMQQIHDRIEEAVDRMKASREPVPVIAVGGGSILLQRKLAGTSETVIPPQYAVANAMGAAASQVGGEVDRVFSYEALGRDQALAQAKREAIGNAEAAGAAPGTIEIMDVEELPLAYVPGGAVRLRAKAVGNLPIDLGGQPISDTAVAD